MFLNFYGLREQPFGVTPDPRFLYLSHTHREVFSSLVYGLESNRGFLALIAEPGMGKTTLLFQLLNRFRNLARTAFVFQTQCTSRELVRHILTDFGVQTSEIRDDVVMLHQAFNDLLTREVRAGRKCLVIVDEAQDLKEPALEALRLLSNFETPRSKLLQIVISGQTPLAARLASPSMSQLFQRLSSISRLLPMNDSDVSAYVDHRLHVAGYKGEALFTLGARDMIAFRSAGVPRRINSLCFNAMSLGYATMSKQIDEYMVDEAAADLALPEVNDGIHRASPEQDGSQRKVFRAPRHLVARTEAWVEADLAGVAEGIHHGSPSGLVPDVDSASLTVDEALFPEMRESPVNRATASGHETVPPPTNGSESTSHGRGTEQDLFELRERASTRQFKRNPISRKRVWGALLIVLVILGTALALTTPVVLEHFFRIIRFRASGDTQHLASATVPEPPLSQRDPSNSIPLPVVQSEPAVGNPASQPRTAVSISSPKADNSERRPKNNTTPIRLRTSTPGQTDSTQGARSSTSTPLSGTAITERPPDGVVSITGNAMRQSQPSSPELVHMVRPIYPFTATSAPVAGTVVLQVVVDPTGNVERVNVVQGDSRLVPVAVNAVKQWKYAPSYRNGVPVEAVTTVSINITPSE